MAETDLTKTSKQSWRDWVLSRARAITVCVTAALALGLLLGSILHFRAAQQKELVAYRAEWGPAMTCFITARGNLIGDQTRYNRETPVQCPDGVQLHPLLSEAASRKATVAVWHSRKTGNYFVANPDRKGVGAEPPRPQRAVLGLVGSLLAVTILTFLCAMGGLTVAYRYENSL